MGKSARKKREAAEARNHQSVASVPVRPRVAVELNPVMTEDEAMKEMAIEFHAQVEHLRLLKLNDEPFSHPDNTHKLDKTFGPMLAWLDQQIATGESDAMQDGTVIFQPEPGDEWYPIGDAFRSVADTYEMICLSHDLVDQSEPLRQLANKVEYDMPLTERDILASKLCIEWMKSVTLSLTPTIFSHFTTAIQTRYTMQAKGILPKDR